jgi:hypothetical protein
MWDKALTPAPSGNSEVGRLLTREDLTNEQAQKLREVMARQLRFLKNGWGRMQQLQQVQFPLDPLYRVALEGRNRVHDPHIAAQPDANQRVWW